MNKIPWVNRNLDSHAWLKFSLIVDSDVWSIKEKRPIGDNWNLWEMSYTWSFVKCTIWTGAWEKIVTGANHKFLDADYHELLK